MRHLLIIHYHFLPVHNVAVKRLVGYARHLPEAGWKAMVLSRDWASTQEADPSWGLSWEPELEASSECSIHRVRTAPFVADPPVASSTRAVARPGPATRLVAKWRRVARMAGGRYPDEFVGWVGPAVRAGARLAHEGRIDAILSYCPPESNHLVARRLARRLGVPWVAFFGDLYGFLESPLPRYSLEGLARRAWHQWCLQPAAACAAVSPAMAAYLEHRYRKPTRIIHSGFEPAEFASLLPNGQEFAGRFVVAHVGSLYPDDQRPEILFDGIDHLLEHHPELRSHLAVRFVGSKCDDRLRAMLRGRPSASVCTVEPKVDSATAISIVRTSEVLLAFSCTAHRDRFGTMSYPTKVFEAFGARRPVLAVPSDGDWLDALLARTGGGASADDAAGVAAQLLEWFRRWQQVGSVPYCARPEEIDALTQAAQARRLAKLLDEVTLR